MRSRSLIALALAGALAVVPLAGCATAGNGIGGIAVAGDTRVDLVTVAAPRLTMPTVDVKSGFPKTSAGGGSASAAKAKAAQQAAAAAAMRRAMPAGVLATVMVSAGSVVHKGQVLAVFDTTLLRLRVANAQAADRRNANTAQALSQQASDLRDQRSQLKDQRAQIGSQLALLQKGIAGQQQLQANLTQLQGKLAQADAGIAQLGQGISQAQKGVAQLQAARAQLVEKLAEAEAEASSTAPPPGIDQVIKDLRAQLVAIDGQIGGLKQTIDDLQSKLKAAQSGAAALRQVIGSLQQVLAGVKKQMPANAASLLAQGQAGLGLMASGLSQMANGIDRLDAATAEVQAAQGIQSVGVEAAKAALAQATLTAPCDGVVVSAMHAGEVAMVGAPVIVIRPAGATLVDTYMERTQLTGVRVGTSAQVSLDSVHGVLKGSVHDISADEEFPPSNYPTQIVHLSRVVRVTVSVPDTLPLGVPADVVIRP